MRILSSIPAFLCISLVAGCSTWPGADHEPGRPDKNTMAGTIGPLPLIAVDFVQALLQIRELPAEFTTVQLLRTSRSDPFTRSMQDALQQAGYAIRWAEDEVAGNLFQYRVEHMAERSGLQRDLYELAVGGIELRRIYRIDESGRVSPVTPLYVRGTDASHIVPRDAPFLDGRLLAIDSLRANAQQRPGNAVAAVAPKPFVPRSTLAVPDEANPLRQLIPDAARTETATLPLIALPRVENVFNLGKSNYQDLLASHVPIQEQVLTFPNDSLRLGELNKQLIEQMVSEFRPHTDMFSVIGCSLGPTQLKSGNAALALGRAGRVREALLFAGIPQERILDEGCWAGDSPDNSLPRRGVVLTLNRQS
ncbi:MAG: hypothetical protein HKN42_11735 [Granulosicoccus sp.]|nr:hypothetical protein [Granulosicoccus sp.]